MKVPVFLFLLFWISSDIPAPVQKPTAVMTETEHESTEAQLEFGNPFDLHDAILELYDRRDYSAAAQHLDYMKSRFADRYASLPYLLLHAKTEQLHGDRDVATQLYLKAFQSSLLRRYSVLPLARIYAEQGNDENAMFYYRESLRDTDHPQYLKVAIEALEFAYLNSEPDLLIDTAQIVRRKSTHDRLGLFFVAKAYGKKGQTAQASSILKNLIRNGKTDDVTSRALVELDGIDGGGTTEEEKQERGRLAFEVWNFNLVRKYLGPLQSRNMQNSYYYARALYFLEDHEGARKAHLDSLKRWPEDSLARRSRLQYGNILMHEGRFEEAEAVYQKLNTQSKTPDVAFKLIDSLRAQNKLQAALKMLQPYTSSRNRSLRSRATFLRARIHVQGKNYKQAYSDLNSLASSKDLNKREVDFWKATVLQKMGRNGEAAALYGSLSRGFDFYAIQALDRLPQAPSNSVRRASYPSRTSAHACILPDQRNEDMVLRSLQQRDVIPALLYLHLYEEAAQDVDSLPGTTRQALGLEDLTRSERLVEFAHIAGLGKNYPSATYYSEVFLNGLDNSVFSLPDDLMKILFPLPYQDYIEKFATERKIDPLFVLSIMRQESRFKEFARSPVFARGLMQLIPSTASKTAADAGLESFSLDQLYTPEVNINLGTKYIQDMISKFGDRAEVLAASYNGGELNTRRWLSFSSSDDVIEFFSNIDLPETKNYVMLVKTNYEWYKRIYRNGS